MPAPRPSAPPFVDLTVVIPAYNEGRRLRPGVEEVCRYLRAGGAGGAGGAGAGGAGGNWELIVV
ncbi:MAG TPA: hypothetical protein DEQ61_18415, partial [Streptomyces sp.]|nr:hypothetical protein [Streptomyces sp.]